MIEDNELKIEGVSEANPAPADKASWSPADEEEKKALANGWIPPHEYKGDQRYYKNAYLYNKEGELYSYISSSNKELNELKRNIQQINERSQREAEQSYKRGVAENAQRMRDAAALGDVKTIDRLHSELIDLNKPYSTPQQTPEQAKLKYDQEVHFAKNSFKMRNPWFDATKPENLDLVKAAREIDQILVAEGLAPEEHFKLLERHVKAKFPDRFNGNTQSVASDNGVTGNTKQKTPNTSDLPKEYQLEISRMREKLPKDRVEKAVADYKNYLREYGLIQ